MQLFSTKFLRFFENNGWLFVSRKSVPYCEGNQTPDAVMILAFKKRSYDERYKRKTFVIVKQKRESLGVEIYELPAGLIDKGETPEQAAIREFKEETGLDLKVQYVTRPVFSSPGLTDESRILVVGEYEGTINPEPGIAVEEWSEGLFAVKGREYAPRLSSELGLLGAIYALENR